MCGENLKKALRVNREIADKKNEAIFAAKRAAMGDSLPSAASASASATASATAASADPVEGDCLHVFYVNILLISFPLFFTCRCCTSHCCHICDSPIFV